MSANRRRTINLKKLYAELHAEPHTMSDATGATSLLNPLATTTFSCHANPAVRCSCCSLLRAPYGVQGRDAGALEVRMRWTLDEEQRQRRRNRSPSPKLAASSGCTQALQGEGQACACVALDRVRNVLYRLNRTEDVLRARMLRSACVR